MTQICLGESQLSAPILGCTLLLLPDSSVGVVLDGSGDYSYSITIPNLPIFNSWHGYWQAGLFDATGPAGITLTGGLDMFVL